MTESSNKSPVGSSSTIPTSGRIVFDPQSCRACKVCEISCSIYHEGKGSASMARINIRFDEFRATDPISATICFQCQDALCVEACPVDALSRHPRTDAVIVDEELCIGCMQCRDACPWDVPKRHPQQRMAIKCNLCSKREKGPLCVEVCPLSGKALRYEPAVP
ncbi:MAG: 4Fe-4S dicluster domain-containing protein [Anaerolineae bacterium]